MHYSSYSTDDFIRDDFFQQWVIAPDDETQAFWENFLAQHPQQQSLVDEARQFLLQMHRAEISVPESRIRKVKAVVDAAIDEYERQLPGSPKLLQPQGSRKHRWRPVYWAAASVVFLLLLSAGWWLGQGSGIRGWRPFMQASLEKVNAKGERSRLTLADGTKVWLNADSRLEYPRDFTGSPTREVYLDGEAFFDVSENPQQPFIVRTSRLSVKVLGTAFNVKSYGRDKTIETTLVRGKVSIAAPTASRPEEIILLPRQKAVFQKDNQRVRLEKQVNTDAYVSWRNGKLIFDNQPLAEILPVLERWYNIRIQVEDSSGLDCRFSATITNKTLEEVLDLFKASGSLEYSLEGRQVTIRGKLCEE